MRAFKTVLIFALSTLLLSTSVLAEDLPRLVDVGADKCIPCIKMAPILDALKEDFAGEFDVIFIDAWKNQDEASKHRVRMIPTQIFYAADGTELYRHVGFYGREDMLNKWLELGYTFKNKD